VSRHDRHSTLSHSGCPTPGVAINPPVDGGRGSGDWLSYVPVLGNAIVLLTGTPGIPIFGALLGFIVSTILAAIFFVLVEIAYNTRNPFIK
jgi:hypothetical protein